MVGGNLVTRSLVGNRVVGGIWTLGSGFTLTLPAFTLGGALTLSGQVFDAGSGNAQINTTGAGKGLNIWSTQDSATGANLSLRHIRPTAANGDYVGIITAEGKDDGGTIQSYGTIYWRIEDVASGTNASRIEFHLRHAGADNIPMTLSGAGEVGADLGFNADEYFKVAGTQVVSAQGAAVADPTDAASTQARLTDLLGRLRTHGLIAT